MTEAREISKSVPGGAVSVLVGQTAEEALPQLFDQLGETIYRLGLAQCRNPQDAEDLLQETFLLAFRNWAKFEGRSKPSTWLYTIASRVCQRKRRRRAGEPRTLESLSELLPTGEARIPDLPSSEEGPLDERLRLEATVKTRVHRARLLLRKRLAARLPRKDAPPPDHPQSVCLDLLRGKQEALDRGVSSPQLEKELCSRCSALFSTLDLTSEVCRELGGGEIPLALRERLLDDLS